MSPKKPGITLVVLRRHAGTVDISGSVGGGMMRPMPSESPFLDDSRRRPGLMERSASPHYAPHHSGTPELLDAR